LSNTLITSSSIDNNVILKDNNSSTLSPVIYNENSNLRGSSNTMSSGSTGSLNNNDELNMELNNGIGSKRLSSIASSSSNRNNDSGNTLNNIGKTLISNNPFEEESFGETIGNMVLNMVDDYTNSETYNIPLSIQIPLVRNESSIGTLPPDSVNRVMLSSSPSVGTSGDQISTRSLTTLPCNLHTCAT